VKKNKDNSEKLDIVHLEKKYNKLNLTLIKDKNSINKNKNMSKISHWKNTKY